MKKIFCVIVAALCVAFVLTAPAFIASGIGKSIYEVRQDERQTRFQGKISLWHVVSFKTPRSSGYSLLKNRMRELEKQLPYVYIDVEGMTLEDARARMAAGERPDVISYPAGAFDEKGMMGLERRRVLSYAAQDGRAYPYMADSYVLAVNADILFENDISVPVGDVMSENAFLLACETIDDALTFSDTSGLDGEFVLSGITLEKDDIGLLESPTITIDDVKFSEGGMEAFSSGKAGMIICPYAEYARFLESKHSSQINSQCYDISTKTDCIQVVSAYESGDDKKDEVLKKICVCLVGKNTQKRVIELGMMPVTDTPAEDVERMNAFLLLTKEQADG